METTPIFEQIDLYVGNTEGYHTLRIPSLVMTVSGTVLAFCEGRRDGREDSGDIDLVLRRSEDGGQTWSPLQVVWNDPGNTCGNPCPVVDRDTGTVWLLMTHNLGQDRAPEMHASTAVGTRTVWVSRSADDGRSWSEPTEITESTKASSWTWYATGPGAGIQLQGGRLLVPCDHKLVTDDYFSHVIYSDDHGETWSIGGTVPDNHVNECEVVELEDGRLLINMRNYDRDQHTRATSISHDAGISWSPTAHDETLVDPICQGSIRRFSEEGWSDRDCILFSNPASESARENMTIRLSYDECKTWSYSRRLNVGPSGYSCLAALPDGLIGCLYERGDNDYRERLTLAMFDLDWLKSSSSDRGHDS